ncbi:MAG: hypothetical protein SNJ62_09165 [Chloracidobacterium sp.]|uniref:Uncharacterized protein n=1 Tax=Chloracidobacterium validum TaxID=2821543 RepID=A0ABX8BCV3_9BACT|nr:hypothetical protein [Chloracidobacterium validum]QUW04247.1 hypothetical protein J8C06_14500 [Chloracidobacterium validum]
MNMQFWEATFPKAEALAVAGLEPYAFTLLSRWKQALQDGFALPFLDKKTMPAREALEERGFLIIGSVGSLVVGMNHLVIVAVGSVERSDTYWSVNVTPLFPEEFHPPAYPQ